MKLSTKGRYGLRALLELAIQAGNGHQPLNLVAERQGMSVSYLEHLFSLMKKAGLVRSVKGAQGGYMLARPADRMRVGDVLRALEGELTLVEEEPGEHAEEDILSRCIRQQVWDVVDRRLNRYVDSITLEELIELQRTREGLSEPMYYI
jgi:Rrf2 family protein